MRGHVRIELDAAGRGTLSLNDTALRGVRAATVESRAGHLTTVTLEVGVETIDYRGEAAVYLTDRAADTLRALGWTPPADQPADQPEKG